ncbi:MAG: adenylate kinase [Parachlamydiaceae bacterium]|nr:adenylate kinase [Parachlamydiaceae bacterium]
MSLTIILAGVPGSGKSTVLQEAVKLFPKLVVINYGDMMLKEAFSQNIDKDSLRKLPLSQQQKIGIEAARRMASEMPEVSCIDTHAMIKTPFGYCPGIPEEVIKILNPNVIGMLESPASLIYERRKFDETRNRDQESLEQIEYHLQISRSFLVACIAFSGALYAPIQNHGAPSDGAKQLITLIQSYE